MNQSRRRTEAFRLIPYPGRFQYRSGPRFYRRIWRLPMLAAHLLLAFPLAWWTYARRKKIDATSLRTFRWWSRVALGILGIRLKVEGCPPEEAVLVAANHVSYLDILALASLGPGQFVAKTEMQSWPFFGLLAQWLGTLFIDRQDARASQRILKQAADVLRQGRIVAVFPEGTTSDGTGVGEFYAAPFESAVSAGAPVLPVALRYEDIQHPGKADRICPFIGEDSLAGHLWRLMAAAPLTLRVHFLPMLSPDAGRRQLAGESRQMVEEALRKMEQGASVTYLKKKHHPLRDAWSSWRRRRHGS